MSKFLKFTHDPGFCRFTVYVFSDNQDRSAQLGDFLCECYRVVKDEFDRLLG